jgi:hypothetical protein
LENNLQSLNNPKFSANELRLIESVLSQAAQA